VRLVAARARVSIGRDKWCAVCPSSPAVRCHTLAIAARLRLSRREDRRPRAPGRPLPRGVNGPRTAGQAGASRRRDSAAKLLGAPADAGMGHAVGHIRRARLDLTSDDVASARTRPRSQAARCIHTSRPNGGHGFALPAAPRPSSGGPEMNGRSRPAAAVQRTPPLAGASQIESRARNGAAARNVGRDAHGLGHNSACSSRRACKDPSSLARRRRGDVRR
jgi:hypothetical protein